jgi:hypothetical protein
MKKTNIRIDNFFIIMEDKSSVINYYKSDIDQIDLWNELPDKELKKYKKNKVTTQVISLFDKTNESSNVNFIILSDEDISDNRSVVVSKVGG